MSDARSNPTLNKPLEIRRVSLIGFGEAGGILGGDLAALNLGNRPRFELATYDVKLDDGRECLAMRAKAESARVQPRASLVEALADADLVISAVTADQALSVATDAARHLKRGQVFLDINSVAPNTKREARAAVEAKGAHYVEAAVMAPVPPSRLRVQMLLGGTRARDLAAFLNGVGMNAEAVSPEIGIASAIKMCRSIMIKGLEALVVECMFAARLHGAEDAVLVSLHASFPHMGWDKDLPGYLMSRVAEHGKRRAAEMREVAAMLDDARLEPHMAAATASRQDWLVDALQSLGLAYDKTKPFVWQDVVDAVAKALDDRAEPPKPKKAGAKAR
jgi:3-hydroxyisobutyrate dehydrogenase-like beta-hydroxyacid dehydrogenase